MAYPHEIDGWLYMGNHRICLVGAYRKSKDDCAYWINHNGYEIQACLLCYSKNMLMRERKYYASKKDKFPDFCDWIDWRIKCLQTRELLLGTTTLTGEI